MRLLENMEVREGICRFRLAGEFTLIEAVELITSAITHCREQRLDRLLVDGTGMIGVPIPSLVDRFLMVEEWASEAKGMVTVVLVVDAAYIHPEKFGVRVAADFGLTCDVYASVPEALAWLSSRAHPA
jgi:hypothetical protein